MFYFAALHLLENETMDIDWGAVVAALVAFGGIVVTWIKMHVALAEIKVRQENQDKRIEALEAMITKQIEVDNEIKIVLGKIQVGQATMTEQLKNLVERLDRVE